MYLTPQLSGISCFSATKCPNSPAFYLVNPHFLDNLAAKELELGPVLGLNHMLLILPLGAGGHDELANVNSILCCGAFQRYPKYLSGF